MLNSQDQRVSLGETDLAKVSWRALWSLQLFRADLAPLDASCGQLFVPPGRCELLLGCESGLALKTALEPKQEREEATKPDVTRGAWGTRGFAQVLLVQISPFLPSMTLVVTEMGFSIYYEDIVEAVLSSPPIVAAKTTSGAFSATRPGVIFIGREDGQLDIWDLTELVAVPAQQILVAAVGV